MKRGQPEYRLHTAVVAHTETCFPQIEFTHAGKGRDKTHAYFLSKMGYKAGTGDIIWCCQGKFGDMECKPPGEKQSSDQITRQRHIEENGGYYIVVYSVKEAHDFWVSLGFKPMHNAIREPNYMTFEDKVNVVTEIFKP